MRKDWVLAAGLAAFGCNKAASQPADPAAKPAAQTKAAPAEKAAGLLIVRLGNNLPPAVTASEQEDAVAALLDRHPVGGLILFNGRWPDTRDRWAETRRRWSAADPADDAVVFRHPIAGPLAWPDALAFLLAHHRHHDAQIARTLRALGRA